MAISINVEVKKNPNESTTSLIRRFTKRVQGSGVLPRVRSVAYRERPLSRLKRKMKTLKSIGRRKEIEKLKKLGKLPEETKYRR
ncbi:MAG: 30S ribosomal protein S21 [Candidatus Yonathbacteria bacterium]|nr:30S ribosomal protein S21 [Candidatus Yonathbacteria bacterium]